jgi:hypothetical protein
VLAQERQLLVARRRRHRLGERVLQRRQAREGTPRPGALGDPRRMLVGATQQLDELALRRGIEPVEIEPLGSARGGHVLLQHALTP